MKSIEELADKFGRADEIVFDRGEGGLVRTNVTTPGGSAELYLHGAHLVSWTPSDNCDVLWTSRKSCFETGKPIRGGVPLCFPWFGPSEKPDSPAHGFARTSMWDIESVQRNDDGRAAVTLLLKSDDSTRKLWDADFELRYTVTVGSKLTISLETRNVGATPLTITQALHSYFAISDIHDISIDGLEGVEYISKVEGLRTRQTDTNITFDGETDRVYINTTSACVLEDRGMERTITVTKTGSNSTVIWNPWKDKAQLMPDFANDEWVGMVCIETANALDNTVTVQPGKTHTITAGICVANF